MKKKLSPKKRVCIFVFLLSAVCGLLALDCNLRFPDNINIFVGEKLDLDKGSSYTLTVPAGFGGVLDENGIIKKDNFLSTQSTGQYLANIKLFGLFPVKDVKINVLENKEVIPCGNSVGIKMFTEGLLCVGVSSVTDKDGKNVNIGSRNDIKEGDIILYANGEKMVSTERFSNLVKNSSGNKITLLINRNNEKLEKDVFPTLTDDGYKLGLWVRDSTAGIGTLTFIDPENETFGALGHPISDSDTGKRMDVLSGSILKANVFDIQKGEKGVPGELKGSIVASSELGSIEKNTANGIYGKANAQKLDLSLPTVKVASRNDIKEGKAYILSNIENENVASFEIEIQRVLLSGADSNKNMIIKITDSTLLSKTGGIVQGMSGSPIIQEGKLVGAVTHVFVNDPTRGYGIFIENMLSEAE